jgi:hypothetical protein
MSIHGIQRDVSEAMPWKSQYCRIFKKISSSSLEHVNEQTSRFTDQGTYSLNLCWLLLHDNMIPIIGEKMDGGQHHPLINLPDEIVCHVGAIFFKDGYAFVSNIIIVKNPFLDIFVHFPLNIIV